MINEMLENINNSQTLNTEKLATSITIEEKQNNFLKSKIGQVINSGIDIGIRAIFPDAIEDEIIAIKDSLLTEGFSAAIDTAIESAINLGKSAIGLITGKFENVTQIKQATEKGGLLDSVSNILDTGLKWASKKGYISKDMANSITKGKNGIMETIKNEINESLENQIEAIEKINGYIEKWQKYYEEENFTNMEYQYKKIQENLEKVIPYEETLKKARQLENIHELIKNNGKNFNLSNEEKELANLLIN